MLRKLGREPALLAGVLVVAVAASTVAVRLVSSPSTAAKVSCARTPITISLGADPSAVSWLSALGASYNDAHHQLDGRCIQVKISQLTLQQAEQALQPVPIPGAATPPDVWVPESDTMVNLVRSKPENASVLPAKSRPIAISPVVLAAPYDAVRVLASRFPSGDTAQLSDLLGLAADKAGWGQKGLNRPEWGSIRFSTVDPGRSALGAGLLVAATAAATRTSISQVSQNSYTTSQAQQGLVALARASATMATSSDDLFRGATQTLATQDMLERYGLIAAYEQDVWQYNGLSPAVVLQATYPFGGALAATYPFVVPSASWVSGSDRLAAADLQSWLMSPKTQNRLDSFGLRRADGTAGAGLGQQERGVDVHPITPGASASAGAAATAQAVWRLLNQRISITGLLDVSGSMADIVPGTTKSKLDLARAASQGALKQLDPRDHVGLWEFSTQLDGDRDYRVLVPLGPAGGTVNGVDRLTASARGYASMRANGATGLYDSVLAAYSDAVSKYAPGYVNTVVLITDGRNEDVQGIDLPTLLHQLQSRYQSSRPVHLITIAYGKDADPAVLGQIAKATDGLSFLSPDPRDIGTVFFAAVSALTS